LHKKPRTRRGKTTTNNNEGRSMSVLHLSCKNNTKKPANYWTVDRIRVEALKYSTRHAFKLGSQTAYAASRRKGVTDEVCSHMTSLLTFWTKESVQHEALKYQHKSDFKRENERAYQAASHNGWFDEVCSHMVPKMKWNFERTKEEALKYNTREDFARGTAGAYGAAKRKNWLNDVCGHMESNLRSDGDVLYVWQVKGTNVYKIGVTSFRLGIQRIVEVSRKMGVEFKIILMKHLNNAFGLETSLLNVLDSVELSCAFTGSREFREIEPHQMYEIKQIVRYYS